MNKLIAFTAILLCLLALPPAILAGSLPAYYPDHFDRWGVIDRLDLNTQEIIIDDVMMHFATGTKTHTLNTEFSMIQSLNKGMKVGVRFSSNNRGLIEEIWVLPKSYSRQAGLE